MSYNITSQASTKNNPFLNKSDEASLLSQVSKFECQVSLDILVESQTRYVHKIANGYKNYGLPVIDLVQEGMVGLIKAIQRFDTERDVRLISFATHWIKAEIHEFILKNVKTVKIATTKNQRKLFFNLRKMSKSDGWLTQSEAEVIAKELNVQVREVFSMENRLRTNDQAFDVSSNDDDDDLGASVFLADESSDIAMKVEKENLSIANNSALIASIKELSEKEQDIIQRRWLSDTRETLATFADEYGVSIEAIRLTEKRAMGKLKSMMVTH